MYLLISALFFRIISNPCANYIQKRLTLNNSALCVNFYSSMFMAFMSLFFIPFIDFSVLSAEIFGYAMLSGLFCFLGTVCLIKALSLGEMSVLGPVNSYKSVVGLIGAFLFLGEAPNLRALLGFLLIVCASFLFLDEEGKFILNKSVALRLLALVFTGIEAVILKKIIILSDPVICFVFWCLTGFIFSFIFALTFKKTKMTDKKAVGFCFITAVLLFIMQISTNYVFKYLEVGLALSLFQFSSVISLFFGFKFLGEKGVIKKSLGTLVMLFGSFLILI